MIHVHRWDAATGTCVCTTPAGLPATAAAAAPDDVWWIDLTDPTPAEEAHIFEKFLPVHPLTLGDITKVRREPEQGAHFPKVEEFDDYLFVVVNPLPPQLVACAAASADAKARIPAAREMRKTRPQLSAILTRHVLITHHYPHLGCVEAVVAFLTRHAAGGRRGPDYLFHLVLDAMVDEYAPVVDKVASRLDRLEATVFRDPGPTVLGETLRLKRVVTAMRKTLVLERDVLARLTRGEFSLVDEAEIAYYRNVFDHLVRYTELIEAAREMAGDLMQTYLAAASNRVNQVMKVLTMISTVVLPMTLVAGIYGMNFEAMPEIKWEYGYPMALTIMATLGIGSIVWFRRKGWL